MKTLEIQYPDTLPDVTSQTEREFQRELKMALASKLFELGRITSGQAADIAGVSRYAFLSDLSRFGVNAVDWDLEEIEAELRNA
jgi:predicted HTH domain antitoxin